MFNFMYIFEISYLEFIKKNFNFKKTHPNVDMYLTCDVKNSSSRTFFLIR